MSEKTLDLLDDGGETHVRVSGVSSHKELRQMIKQHLIKLGGYSDRDAQEVIRTHFDEEPFSGATKRSHPDMFQETPDREVSADNYAKEIAKYAHTNYGDVVKESTDAMNTLKPSSMTGDNSRTGMMSTVVNMMSTMTKSDLVDFFNQSMQQYGPNADLGVSDGQAQSNMATIATKGSVKEDVDQMFDGKELTEQFKEDVATLIEAAVNTQLGVALAEMVEQQEQLFDELVEEYKEEITEQVDEYLSYVVKEWAEENKMGIENQLKLEIQESFMNGLLNLFKEHYVDVPEEKYDVLADLERKVQELEDTINTLQDKNIQLAATNEELNCDIILNNMAKDLTVSESAKFFSLAEGLSYNDLDHYTKKLNTIKETYFGNNSKPNTKMITEEQEIMGIASLEEESENPQPKLDGQMAKYAQAISRTIKR